MVNTPAVGHGYSMAAAKQTNGVKVNGITPQVGHPTFPYSARRETKKLDMDTVERKGQFHGQDVSNRPRIYDIPEAPTYRPTEAEFQDPMSYMRSIAKEASKYGICKIIPPDSWNPEFAVDTERFHFRTRKQEINLVEGSNRTNLNYLDQLAKFHKQFGTQLNRFPSVDKRPLDLYKLKKAVEVRGGLEAVCKDKKWAEIGRDLGYSGKIMSSLSTSLKNSYQRWLYPYEKWLEQVKSGGQPQIDASLAAPTGSKCSPSAHPWHPQATPVPSTQQDAPHTNGSPPTQTGAQSHSFTDPPRPCSPQRTSAALARSRPSGFTPVNGGFTAVNTPCTSKTAMQASPVCIKSEMAHLPPTLPSGFASMNGSSYEGPRGVDADTVLSSEQHTHSLKRAFSQEDLNEEDSSEGSPDGEPVQRRSKRPRRDVPNGPVLSMRPSTPQGKKSAVRRHGDKCEICGHSADKPNILLCDTCDLGHHRYCVDPPLMNIPDYEWHCSKCLVGSNDYGFEEGNVYSLTTFQEKANNFKKHYFEQRMPLDPTTNAARVPTEDEVEREFWRLVEDITESVEVEYGADIHSTTHGSGFPTIEKNPLSPYSRDPWNLNVLPFHAESLFRHIKGDISGMTVPWLYVGMCFSTFCWHNEDHYAYSANYQHLGATKTWYGIPGADALSFESAMREAVPELFESQPDLLFQLVTILPPNQLKKAGVHVYALDQRAGEFVITFPQAYHAGFNHGFNLNEAVNFAPADWEPFGDAGVQRLREFRKNPCFSHEELLFTAAACDATIPTAKWLAPALERVEQRELEQRQNFVIQHKQAYPHEHCTFETLSEHVSPECGLKILVRNKELEEEEYQCQYCKVFTYLSQFMCDKTKRVGCLQHIEQLDCCELSAEQRLRGNAHTVVLRYDNHELRQIVRKVVNKANVPQAWEAKLENTLQDEARPSLKSLQALLAEGEKIDAPLSELDDLAEFVSKCNAWVEEANIYVTRKQQNRRKNEKAWRRSSTKPVKSDERESDTPLTLERMQELIDEGEHLGFSASQVESLQEKFSSIDDWRDDVKSVFLGTERKSAEELEIMLEEGRSFGIAMEEIAKLDKLQQRAEWAGQIQKAQENMLDQTLDGMKELLRRATDLDIPQHHVQVQYLEEVVQKGNLWELKANEIMTAEDIHYPQLEALYSQVQSQQFPVNKEILSKMDFILAKNREAKKQIVLLVEKCKDLDFRKRPPYAQVRDVMKRIEELNGKPLGAADLEKEVKRHEDWMRKGKKLFGKANAPLHILEQHMRFVDERNNFCFDLNDTFRPPVEPASREASPVEGQTKHVELSNDAEEKPVFCLCRQPEAGLMIECEICHDWYHAKCLKLARGKVKTTETFTCPICDWRVKIPRDAARPKLEDLQAWADEMVDLPFQPEEEDLLNRICDKAQAFRDFLGQYTNGNHLTRTSDEKPEMLFYLRKIEGAEVLLAYETNVFRQELHKWQPIADRPPPILDQSLSTRKPRPTKQQKLMKELGVAKPEDLPPHLRTKQYTRKKPHETIPTGPLMPRPLADSPSIGGSADSPNTGSMADVVTASRPDTNSKNARPYGFSAGTYDPPYTTGDATTFPETTPSPMFSPTSERPGVPVRDTMITAIHTPSLNGHNHGEAPFSMFQHHDDNDVTAGLADVDTHERDDGHVERHLAVDGEYDGFFREMTNQDDENTADEPPILATETSQAGEALEIMAAEDDADTKDNELRFDFDKDGGGS